MQREINEVEATPDSKDSKENIGISDSHFEDILNFVKTFNFYPTERSRPLARCEHYVWEIWRSRIGHPDASRGSSGGLRIIHFYNFKEHKGYLAKMWPKGKTLGKKAEKEFDKYWKSLKKELQEVWSD